jgi:hypothetical protein
MLASSKIVYRYRVFYPRAILIVKRVVFWGILTLPCCRGLHGKPMQGAAGLPIGVPRRAGKLSI